MFYRVFFNDDSTVLVRSRYRSLYARGTVVGTPPGTVKVYTLALLC